MKTRKWVWAILVLAFLGLADASYLAQHAVSNTPLICNVQNLSGCNIVAQSPYSRLFGVPLAVYGLVFYGILFVLSALELVIFDRILRRILQGVALAGLLASLYFVGVQITLIKAFCIYCFASAVISLVIFGCATAIEPLKRRDEEIAGAMKRTLRSIFGGEPGAKVPFSTGKEPRTDLPMPPRP